MTYYVLGEMQNYSFTPNNPDINYLSHPILEARFIPITIQTQHAPLKGTIKQQILEIPICGRITIKFPKFWKHTEKVDS